MAFSAAETAACRRLIDLALDEDLGKAGDLTSQAVIPADLTGQAAFVARETGVVGGLPAAALVAEAINGTLRFQPLKEDGELVRLGDRLATIAGPMRGILAAERTVLNFLQHLSGIASLTRRYVDAVAGSKCKILDTRKTLPGWRLLAKYAVRCGGGRNHRMGLSDGVLIKDNHLAALASRERERPENRHEYVAAAVTSVRTIYGAKVPVEVEVDSLEQLDAALACRPDIVLLDNMSIEKMREAVHRRDAVAPTILLEASGGVTLATVRAIAETGVDRISVGALTHSAPAFDIALDYCP